MATTAILSCAFLAESAWAGHSGTWDNGEAGSGTWALDDDGNLTISGTGSMPKYGFHHNGSDFVTSAESPWYQYRSQVKFATVSEGITSLGSSAFTQATSLKSVQLPSTLTSVGINSFYNNKSLETVDIPDSVTIIDYQAFAGSGIKSVALPANLNFLQVVSFSGANSLEVVDASKVITNHANTAGNPYISAGKIICTSNQLKSGGFCAGNKINGYSTGGIAIEKGDGYYKYDGKYYFNLDHVGNPEQGFDHHNFVYNDDGSVSVKNSAGQVAASYDSEGKQTASYNYSTGGLLLSANTYDSEGNINGSYTYDAGGNLVSAYQNGKAVYLRKRYTIPEADAATQGKGPFRLDITW